MDICVGLNFCFTNASFLIKFTNTVELLKSLGPNVCGYANFAGSWGRYFMGKLYDVTMDNCPYMRTWFSTRYERKDNSIWFGCKLKGYLVTNPLTSIPNEQQ